MTLVILCITAGNAAIQWVNTGSAVKGTISSYNMSIASHYVTQIDAGRYSEFPGRSAGVGPVLVAPP
ncbi:hypothetical protein ACFSQ7_07240 [Paenibacillus rhizoplanae]